MVTHLKYYFYKTKTKSTWGACDISIKMQLPQQSLLLRQKLTETLARGAKRYARAESGDTLDSQQSKTRYAVPHTGEPRTQGRVLHTGESCSHYHAGSEWSECTWKNQGIDKWRKQSAEEQVWHSPTMKFKNDNMNTLINMGVNINPRGKSHMTMHQPIC